MVKSFEGPTREQVLRMAREAGADMHCDTLCINGKDADDFLIRFAALAYAAGQEAERDACAITAWNVGMDQHNKSLGLPCDAREVGSYAANAIRAMGNK